MWTKAFPASPPRLIVLAALIFTGILLSREASVTEDLPVFLPVGRDFVHVELIGEVLVPGVHQIHDGLTLFGVMKLTHPQELENLMPGIAWDQPLQSGERLEIVRKDRKLAILRRGWMSASHRVALTIPLHPDRMSSTDWQTLPGIGTVLAERIENSRQENGDFGSLEGLLRVKGIGKKRIERWREFFADA